MRHLDLYLEMRSHHEMLRQNVQEHQELVGEQTAQRHCQQHHEQVAVEERERVEVLARLQDPRSAWRNSTWQTPLRQYARGLHETLFECLRIWINGCPHTVN